MAEKKTSKKLERAYVVPIRRSTVKTARYLRAKKAVSTIRKFMKRHMKSDDIKIGQELNEVIWARGGKYVPGKLNLTAVKEDDVVKVNLTGIEKKEAAKKKEAPEKKGEKPAKKEAAPKGAKEITSPPKGVTEEVIPGKGEQLG
jgi:large subunit ribosomal protein L31e